ncbi:hypothetical protein DPMN_126102 [Dreissena polymorpha]|uniref:Uncharacterized protein n=1 Tax=Dreissena polymorpha TaxID=45954 RepID=A0A9D4JXT6_DREPO|nr:hypothetical protein DPMN_126102 [Dreissena polymorpha]
MMFDFTVLISIPFALAFSLNIMATYCWPVLVPSRRSMPPAIQVLDVSDTGVFVFVVSEILLHYLLMDTVTQNKI